MNFHISNLLLFFNLEKIPHVMNYNVDFINWGHVYDTQEVDINKFQTRFTDLSLVSNIKEKRDQPTS